MTIAAATIAAAAAMTAATATRRTTVVGVAVEAMAARTTRTERTIKAAGEVAEGEDDHGGRHDGNGRGNIEATFSDGSRVEIENGRFERKDANGRTVEERQATAADLERLRVGNGRSGQERSGGGIVAKAEVEGGNIEVTYTDGWKEEIEGGRYELKDALEPDRRGTAGEGIGPAATLRRPPLTSADLTGQEPQWSRATSAASVRFLT